MGHFTPGPFPSGKKWRRVVDMLTEGSANAAEIAAAAVEASNTAFKNNASDPAYHDVIWYLVQLPLAARAPDYVDSLRALGLDVPDAPTALDLTGALSDALDARAQRANHHSDLAEMAHMAAIETLLDAFSSAQPDMFAADAEATRRTLANLASGDAFGQFARSFYARLMQRGLSSFLSRELSNHVGPGKRFTHDQDRRGFDAALGEACYEAAQKVQAFAGDWFGRHVYRDADLDRDVSDRFASYAFTKLRKAMGDADAR